MKKAWPTLKGMYRSLLGQLLEPEWQEAFTRDSDFYLKVQQYLDPTNPNYGKAAPSTVFTGMIAYANGVDWNPAGTGVAGLYQYNGSAWKSFLTSLNGTFTGQAPYNSGPQTITSAGALPLAHGLTGVTSPELIQITIYLQNVTTEGNYSVGDLVLMQPHQFFVNGASTFNQGVSIVPDATYLNIRFAATSSVFRLPDKTTGAYFSITNTKWNAIFVARY